MSQKVKEAKAAYKAFRAKWDKMIQDAQEAQLNNPPSKEFDEE